MKKKYYFLEKIFILANLSINVILKNLFLILINVKINWIKQEIFEKKLHLYVSYSNNKINQTHKKKRVKTALFDLKKET